MFNVIGDVVQQRFNVRRKPVLDQFGHAGVRERRERRWDDAVNKEASTTRDGDEMIDAFGFVIQNNGFAAVSSWTVPAVGWLERVVHDQTKRSLVKDARVEHLAVAWFEHAKFLEFSGEQHHGKDEQRQRLFVHGGMCRGGHLNMWPHGS